MKGARFAEAHSGWEHHAREQTHTVVQKKPRCANIDLNRLLAALLPRRKGAEVDVDKCARSAEIPVARPWDVGRR